MKKYIPQIILTIGALFIVSSAFIFVYLEKENIINQAGNRSLSLASAGAAKINNIFHRTEAGVIEISRLSSLINASENKKICDDVILSNMNSFIVGFPEVVGYRIWTENGDLTCGNGLITNSKSNVADREYFKILKNGKTGIIFSDPIVSRSSGKNVVAMVTAIKNKNQQFIGVAGAIIELESLTASMIESIKNHKNAVVTIRDSDSTLWAKIYNNEAILNESGVTNKKNKDNKIGYQIGTKRDLNHPLFSKYKTGTPSGVAIYTHQDGIDRVSGFYKINNYPIFINVSFSLEEILQDWWNILGFFILTTIMSISILFLGVLKWIQAIEKKSQFSMIDIQTGIINRMGAVDFINKLFKKTSDIAIIEISLKGLKAAEDAFGHSFFNDCILIAANRIKSAVDLNATIARTSSSGFLVILPNITASHAQNAAQHCIDVLTKPFEINSNSIVLRAAAGISIWNESICGNISAEDFIVKASSALRHAWSKGSDSVEIFSEEISAIAKARIEMAAQLRTALINPTENGMFLAFQPIYDTTSLSLRGFEVLARWTPVGKKPISPADFVSVAEEHDLILQLGYNVLSMAVRQIAIWIDQGIEPPPISVNVSALQILKSNFPETIANILNSNSVPARFLKLEITESAAMDNRDADRFMGALDAIRFMGCPIAVDDFGTGYSSLARLRDLPADTLKIDRSIVQAINDAAGRELCLATIALSKSLSMKTVGEGVETAEQLEFLAKAGCDMVQGFFTGKPVVHEDAKEIILNKNL